MGQSICTVDENDFNNQLPHLSYSDVKMEDTKQLSHPDQPPPDFAEAVDTIPTLSSKILQRLDQLPIFEFASDEEVINGTKLKPYRLKNDAVYVGEWKAGEINGKGEYYLPDGSYLQCYTYKNQILGNGRIIYVNSDYYEGPIINNKANGRGRYVQDEIIFDGEVKDNELHGFGQQKGRNFVFTGKFENGERKQGKLIWQDNGEKYQYIGSFKDGFFDGDGILVTGKIKSQGTFKKGMKNGLFKTTHKNGAISISEFHDDSRIGKISIYDNPEKQNNLKGKLQFTSEVSAIT